MSLFGPLTRLTVSVPEVYTAPRSKADSTRPRHEQHGRHELTGEVNAQNESRWRTKEFMVYYVVVTSCIVLMIAKGMALSRSTHHAFHDYSHRLSRGYFNQLVDNSDAQYSTFRDGLPSLVLLALGYKIAAVITEYFGHKSTRGIFLTASGVLFILLLHGISAIKVLAILSINYLLAKQSVLDLPGTFMIWAFNIAVLFLNDMCNGYHIGVISPSLAFLDDPSLNGLMPRWYVSFNITVLRLLSFALDYRWAVRAAAQNRLDQDLKAPPSTPDARSRVKDSRKLSEYSYSNYLAYVLYPPLYIAGPIITFNDFASQIKTPCNHSKRSLAKYCIRFAICWATMECILHNIFVVAIKDSGAWTNDTPFEISMIGYWNLIIVWLKLLIPWRFFRLWSLMDNVDPPENMIRCMSNNYSTLGFWRSWHRSYNLWIIRYLYVPVGGSTRLIPSLVLVFSFVALWHDLSLRLLAWGWSVVLFVLPEVTLGYIFSEKRFGHEPWYRHICALGGALNVFLMMTANLIGFVVGLEGVREMWSRIVSTASGYSFLIAALAAFFSATQLMMEYRRDERRQNIYRKC